MKKIHLLAILSLVTFFIYSCATSKEARTKEKSINGTWQLETIITEDISGKIKAQIFNEGDYTCFPGSVWKFNQNNNLGSYSLSKNEGTCVSIVRDFRWSIYEKTRRKQTISI